MTPDEILAKVREAREQENRGCIGSNVSELCDIIDGLVGSPLPPESPPGHIRVTATSVICDTAMVHWHSYTMATIERVAESEHRSTGEILRDIAAMEVQ